MNKVRDQVACVRFVITVSSEGAAAKEAADKAASRQESAERAAKDAAARIANYEKTELVIT